MQKYITTIFPRPHSNSGNKMSSQSNVSQFFPNDSMLTRAFFIGSFSHVVISP